MKRILLAIGLWLGLTALAVAQPVNVVPSPGLITDVLKKITYSASAVGIVPASSATDIFCISGSSSKAISIKNVSISGTAGTLVSAPFSLNHHASLDTGTATTITPSPHASTNPTATATVVSYAANPTIVDSSPTTARTAYLSLPTTAANIAPSPLIFTMGTGGSDFFFQGFDIPSGKTAEQWCVNLNTISVSSGLIDVSIDWFEQ